MPAVIKVIDYFVLASQSKAKDAVVTKTGRCSSLVVVLIDADEFHKFKHNFMDTSNTLLQMNDGIEERGHFSLHSSSRNAIFRPLG